jgi:hypothetical protein
MPFALLQLLRNLGGSFSEEFTPATSGQPRNRQLSPHLRGCVTPVRQSDIAFGHEPARTRYGWQFAAR